MDTQEDKNKAKDSKEQIKMLEKDMKAAFKEGNHELLKKLGDQLKALDPENHVAMKLIQKDEEAVKKEKVKQYEDMLKKLAKEKDSEKLSALAKEFKDFDPENKHADKWMKKADKLAEKMGSKKADEGEKAKDNGEEKKEPGFFARIFKKSDKEEKPNGIFAKAAEQAKPAEAKSEQPKAEAKPMPAAAAPAAPAKTPMPTPAPTPAPVAPLAPKTEAPKPLAPKAAEPAKPAETPKPMTPKAPAAPAPLASKPAPAATPAPAAPKPAAAPAPAKPAMPTAPAKEAPKEAPKGNLFTKMFGKKEEETQKKSIIDTIVAKADKKEEKKEPEKKPAMKKLEQPKEATGLLTFSKIFMNFAAIFIVLSGAFLYVEWVDTQNTMLSLVGIPENTGSRLHNASTEVDDLKRQEAVLNKEIELYKGGYNDKAIQTVDQIIENRINWPDIFAKINEVTNSVYELNDFFKYIEYNNYSFDAENGTIRVTGSLSDPLGRNLTKLVELENAFKYYPKDMDNPDDPTQPYFTGFREFTSFSKTLDPSTGRYNSNFQLSFALNE